MALKVGELFASLRLDDKDFNAGVDRAGGKFGGLASGVAKGGLLIGGALAGVGVATGVMAANFEAGMANVQTLLGKDGTARVKELEQSVKDMSVKTGASLDDLSQGLYDVIGTFGDTADSAKLVEIAATAGKAGLATTSDAVLLLGAVTKSYGDTSSAAAQKAADLAFQTANLGVTTFPELAKSMGAVLPLAATMKVSQEELFGAYAALTGVTGNTAEVTTQLKGAMTALLNANPVMVKALKDQGFSSGTAAIKTLGLQGALQMLVKASGGSQLQLAKMLGSSEALTAVLALTGAQAQDFTDKTKAMGNAAGATDAAFEIQQKTVSATFERVKASIGVVAVNLGQKLLPMFQTMLDWVVKNMPTIQAIFDAVFAAVGKVVDVVRAVVVDFMYVVGAAFRGTAENADEAGGFWTGFGLAVQQVIQFITGTLVPALSEAFTFIAEQVIPAIGAAFAWYYENILPILIEVLTVIIEDVIPALVGAFTVVAEDVIPALGAAFTWIAENVIPVLQAVLEGVVAWFSDNWPTISSVAGQVFGAVSTVFQVLANVIGTVVPIIWGILEPIASVLLPLIGTAAGILLGAIDVAFKAIGAVWQVAADVAGTVASAITDAWDGLSGFFTGLWNGISGAVRGGINAVIGMVNGMIGFLNGIQIHIPEIGVGPVHTPAFDWWGLRLGKIPYLATGARDFTGGMAIVGEHGPELVQLPRGVDVFSNRDSRAMFGQASERAGGTTINNYVTVNGELEDVEDPDDVLKVLQRLTFLSSGVPG